MNLTEFLSAASEAWTLLGAHPLRWIAVVVVFLLAVESLMFIPYVGFVIKLAVAGVVVPQIIAMFAAASQGQLPIPSAMLGAFSVPLNTMLVLVAAALIPFAGGVAFLYAKGGWQAIEFFFGNVFKVKPPPAHLFEQFKYVMQLLAIPFTLLAGAVVVKGLVGLGAASAAVSAAVTNWLPVLVIGALAFVFEWLSAQLPHFLPKPAAAVLGIALLIAFLAFSFSLTYTVSARVFRSGTPA